MKIMEIIWLLAGLFSLGAGIHAFSLGDTKRSLIFFIMVVISFFIFTMRIRIRKRNEKESKRKDTE